MTLLFFSLSYSLFQPFDRGGRSYLSCMNSLNLLLLHQIISSNSLYFITIKAFGFRRVKSGVCSLLLCIYPVFGETLARQRCQCNGSLWSGGCSSWWCDEWCCDMMCCTYRYNGLADADETAFAAGIALQAYFEGRKITREEMNKCLDHYHDNISERTDPEGRKRDVCW